MLQQGMEKVSLPWHDSAGLQLCVGKDSSAASLIISQRREIPKENAPAIAAEWEEERVGKNLLKPKQSFQKQCCFYSPATCAKLHGCYFFVLHPLQG